MPSTRSLGILSTYPPTPCGLATFTSALRRHLAAPDVRACVVRVVDRSETHPGVEVIAHLVNGNPSSAAVAIDELNRLDAVIVQHEYGIYGGRDGRDVLDVVAGLTVPAIVVLHTVLEHPSPSQRDILLRLIDLAAVVVTMTQAARRRLLEIYGADAHRVVVIPHGAVGPGAALPRARRPGARPLVLTWGLLGPGKGIEWAIDAMAGLRDLRPRYLVAGRTHPKVLEREGETYREGLRRRISAREVEDIVELDANFLPAPALAELVSRADVVLLPYDSREQVTSGVLIEAVAAGRPVVSTAFPHAVELLGSGVGLVVPQRDTQALEVALRRVLAEPGLSERMAASAARRAPELLWSAVARRYRGIVDDLVAAALVAAP
jgi:glycosyltransferase involved in cell wall biosynthesis